MTCMTLCEESQKTESPTPTRPCLRHRLHAIYFIAITRFFTRVTAKTICTQVRMYSAWRIMYREKSERSSAPGVRHRNQIRVLISNNNNIQAVFNYIIWFSREREYYKCHKVGIISCPRSPCCLSVPRPKSIIGKPPSSQDMGR